MATVGAFPVLRGEIAISSVAWTPGTTVSGMTFTDIEAVNDPNATNAQDTADSRSNDSGGEKEFINTWRGGGATFEMVTKIGSTQQTAVWTNYIAGNIMGWRLRPSGGVTGDDQEFFAASITGVDRVGGKEDAAKFKVTLQRTLGITRSSIP
jgi:hypothetical protein